MKRIFKNMKNPTTFYSRLRFIIPCFVLLLCSSIVKAGDWPMWRSDAGRTASTPDALPEKLVPLWKVTYSPRKMVWKDILNQDIMPYDRSFEPIVVGKTLMIGFNDSDKMVALNTETGQELWRFYTNGPVRLPGVANDHHVFFSCDDGYLYCLKISDGSLVWKFRGGPSERKMIGNERLISTWPARGGPVLYDNEIYFSSSIWPMMGTFIYSLNAETGKVVWVNDSTSADYIMQPHNYPAYAGIAPQGAFAATEKELMIPGGRSVPSCFDRKTGKLKYYHLGRYGKSGGSGVMAVDNYFYGHYREGNFYRFKLKDGMQQSGVVGKWPVVTKKNIYFSGEKVSKHVNKSPRKSIWKIDANAEGDLIKAGNTLYAAGKGTITSLKLKEGKEKPEANEVAKIKGEIVRLVAADNKLFAVTLEGSITALGESSNAKVNETSINIVKHKLPPKSLQQAKQILDDAGNPEGYSLFYGIGDGNLLEAIAIQSKLQIIAIDPDVKKIRQMRKRLDEAGLYGTRVTLFPYSADNFLSPPYMSSLSIVYDSKSAQLQNQPVLFKRLYQSLRPYGGTVYLMGEKWRQGYNQEKAELFFPKVKMESNNNFTKLIREGSLQGAGTWTHQYGNIQNTVKSNDSLVKLPLGVLWFGGSSNSDVLPRHGHGPPEQIVSGRLVIQGMECISARDVYTGRVLWKTDLGDLGSYGSFFDQTYKDTPTSTAYNQVHIPGANSRGTNFVTTNDRIYIIKGHQAIVLDAATGKKLEPISLSFKPKNGKKQPGHPDWGYIGVYEDYLIAGAGFAYYTKNLDIEKEKTDNNRSKDRYLDYDKTASLELVIMNRYSGKVLWRVDSKYSFLHNSIIAGNGLLYCLDKLPNNIEEKLVRRGKGKPKGYQLRVFDIKTGSLKWDNKDDIFGSWLGYSKERDVLLHSTRPSSDTVRGENGSQLQVFNASTGKSIWKKSVSYGTPPILHGNRIITGGRMYDLMTGETQYRLDPITGEKRPWTYISTKGCNYPIASSNLITFRSSAAAFYDLVNDGGTGHLGGFKSGCTSNLIAAEGVLNAPDYTRTCSCGFQNQTSLALIHMPELEMWTHNDFSYDGNIVQRVGINFGAPGDRRADDGTLWLEYPKVGGPSPTIQVKIPESATFFRHHASKYGNKPTSWVDASGIVGAENIEIHLIPIKDKSLGYPYPIASPENDATEEKKGRVDSKNNNLIISVKKRGQVTVLRFENMPIPAGSKIEKAVIQFQSAQPSKKPASAWMYAEDSGNSKPLTNKKKNFSSRKRTKASLKWKIPVWKLANESSKDQQTPDISKLIQAVIDRPDWKEGNSFSIIMKGSGSRVVSSADKAIANADGKTLAPTLFMKMAHQPEPAEDEMESHRYTVRLHFAEPEEKTKAGERQFNIYLQESLVLPEFDILSSKNNTPSRSLVKEFRNINIAGKLKIRLEAKSNKLTVLSGVEIVKEN